MGKIKKVGNLNGLKLLFYGAFVEIVKKVVRIKRLELPCLSAPDPKSGVSTNFTISAHNSSKFCEALASS